MGFLFGGGKKESAFTPPAPAPAPVVSEEGPKEDPKKARRGAASSMLTGNTGLTSSANTGAKSLLGQ